MSSPWFLKWELHPGSTGPFSAFWPAPSHSSLVSKTCKGRDLKLNDHIPMTGDFGWTLLYKQLGFSVSSGLKKSHQSHAVLWYKAVKVPASAGPPSRQHTPHCRCLKQGDTLLPTRRPIPERAHCTHANTPQPQGESLVPRFPIRDPRPPTLRQTHTALRLPLRLYWLFIGQWLPLSCPVPSSPLSPPSGALHVPLSPPMH